MAKQLSAAEHARYRPFRAAVWTLYLGFVSIFSLCVIVSVARSVFAMTPVAPPSQADHSVATCVQYASEAFKRLDEQRQNLSRVGVALHADDVWDGFRVEWLAGVRAEESACRLEDPDRRELKDVFARLEKLEHLYTTSAVQYAGQIGPSVDGLRQELGKLAPGPLSPTE